MATRMIPAVTAIAVVTGLTFAATPVPTPVPPVVGAPVPGHPLLTRILGPSFQFGSTAVDLGLGSTTDTSVPAMPLAGPLGGGMPTGATEPTILLDSLGSAVIGGVEVVVSGTGPSTSYALDPRDLDDDEDLDAVFDFAGNASASVPVGFLFETLGGIGLDPRDLDDDEDLDALYLGNAEVTVLIELPEAAFDPEDLDNDEDDNGVSFDPEDLDNDEDDDLFVYDGPAVITVVVTLPDLVVVPVNPFASVVGKAYFGFQGTAEVAVGFAIVPDDFDGDEQTATAISIASMEVSIPQADWQVSTNPADLGVNP